MRPWPWRKKRIAEMVRLYAGMTPEQIRKPRGHTYVTIVLPGSITDYVRGVVDGVLVMESLVDFHLESIMNTHAFRVQANVFWQESR